MRSGARKGIVSRSIRRSLTTPSSTATAAEKGADRVGENGKGEREDHPDERRQDGISTAAARKSSTKGVSSLTTASSTQAGAGGEKRTRQQCRGTLSSAGLNMSSDNGMGSNSVAAAPEGTVVREGALTATFAGSARPQSRREDDQSKENEDEDQELSRRQPSEEDTRGQTGRGVR